MKHAVAVAFLLAVAVAGAGLSLLRDASASSAAAPSFAREVAPILQAKCAGCHAVGGIAPFPFRTAADVASRAAAVVAAVESGRMPPWPPGPRSPDLVGHAARTLSDAQRDTVVGWAKGQLLRPGAPRDRTPVGAHRAATTRPRAGEKLLGLRPATAYLPRAAKGATDDYRCFLVDPELAADSFVTSARIEPGADAIVHHVILFRVPRSSVARARALDRSSPGAGWGCFGGTGIDGGRDAVDSLENAPWISAWAPGSGTQRLGGDLGIRLPRGSQVVMQVHYNLSNGPRSDRSRAVLTTVPATAKRTPVQTVLLPAPVELPCPAGETGALCSRSEALADQVRRYGTSAGLVPIGLLLLCGQNPAAPTAGSRTSCDRRIDGPSTIHAVAGHMHLLGRALRIELNPGTPRARILLDLPRWDFHWQGAYGLRQPVQVKRGDVVRVTCTYDPGLRRRLDSPAARTPRYTLWGEGTADEMCLGILQVSRG